MLRLYSLLRLVGCFWVESLVRFLVCGELVWGYVLTYFALRRLRRWCREWNPGYLG
jgi:hypothetical protein